MYKVASRLQQGARERILPRHIPAADVDLTPEQKRQNLVSIVKQLNVELAAGVNKKRRAEIGARLHELNQEIHALRAKPKVIGIEQAFIDEAREQLSSIQFGRIMRAAAIRAGRDPVGEPR